MKKSQLVLYPDNKLEVETTDYYFVGEDILHGHDIVENVDKDTFKRLNSYYGCDKKMVFSGIFPSPAADLNSFEVLEEDYARDKNHVFVHGNIIQGADRDSFKYLKCSYSIDKNNLFCDEKMIEGADRDSFIVLSERFAKDKKSVFHYGEKLKNLDPAIFFAWDKNWARVKDKIYSSALLFSDNPDDFFRDNPDDFQTLVAVKDISTFKGLGDEYAKDSLAVYYGSDGQVREIEGADPSSFEFLGLWYARDANHVYNQGEIIEDADPESFELLTYDWCYDKKSLYYDQERIEGNISELKLLEHPEYYILDKGVYLHHEYLDGVDPETFVFLNSSYMKDKNHVYCRYGNHKPLKDVDLDSFVIIKGAWAKDNSNTFYKGTLVPDVNPNEFVILEDLINLRFRSHEVYAKDDKTVYYGKKSIQGADPVSFKLSSKEGWAEDKFNLYDMGEMQGARKLEPLSNVLFQGITNFLEYRYTDSIIVEIGKDYLYFHTPSYDGMECSDYLLNNYLCSFENTKRIIEKHGSEIHTGSCTFVSHEEDIEIVEAQLSETFNKLGYPLCKTLVKDNERIIKWIGFDLKIDGEVSDAINWDFEEYRIFSYLLRFILVYFKNQMDLYKHNDKKLNQLTLTSGEFIRISLNGDEDTWFPTDIYSPILTMDKSLSFEMKQLRLCEILCRAFARLEITEELNGIRADNFKAEIVSLEYLKIDFDELMDQARKDLAVNVEKKQEILKSKSSFSDEQSKLESKPSSSDEPWKLERSRSATSKCNICGELIEKNAWRLGSPYSVDKGGKKRTAYLWHHHTCVDVEEFLPPESISRLNREMYWKLEHAKSSRSKCKKCKEKIEKGTYRLGKPYDYDGHETYQWYHVVCVKNVKVFLKPEDYLLLENQLNDKSKKVTKKAVAKKTAK